GHWSSHLGELYWLGPARHDYFYLHHRHDVWFGYHKPNRQDSERRSGWGYFQVRWHHFADALLLDPQNPGLQQHDQVAAGGHHGYRRDEDVHSEFQPGCGHDSEPDSDFGRNH